MQTLHTLMHAALGTECGDHRSATGSMHRNFVLLVAVAMFLAFGGYSPTSAITLVSQGVYPANGNLYQVYYAPGISWDDANAFVGTLSIPGYFPPFLATIHSDGENSFVNSLRIDGVGNNGEVWLGGFQPPDETDPSASWQWITGEPWSYTNWAAMEPNDYYGPASEQHLAMWTGGYWNDEGNLYNITGFVVEAVVIPEPTSLLLFGVGLAGVAFRLRRQR